MSSSEAIAHIRQHPELYLPGGRLDPSDLASRLAYDALTFGATRTMVAHRDQRWAVAADVDWLAAAPLEPARLFERIVPFPEAGPNSMRSEVLIGALSDDVTLWTPSARQIIKGNGDPLATVGGLLRDPAWVRVVAFRLDPASLDHRVLAAAAPAAS